MKVHSFVRESMIPVIEARKNPHFDRHDLRFAVCTFMHYIYFLYAPTIIFRKQYPRTSKVRWGYVLSNFMQVVMCLFYSYYIFIRFCKPLFENSGREAGNLRALFESVFLSMLPGTLLLLLMFFTILHSWLNAWAGLRNYRCMFLYELLQSFFVSLTASSTATGSRVPYFNIFLKTIGGIPRILRRTTAHGTLSCTTGFTHTSTWR
jgi:sterol O-acyltransferase